MLNFRQGLSQAAQSVANTAGQLITDEVAQLREQRMAEYQSQQQAAKLEADSALQAQKLEADQAATADERAFQIERDEANAARDQRNAIERIKVKGATDPSGVQVNVNNGQDLDTRTQEFSKAIGKADAERYTGIVKAADSAAQMEDSLHVLEEISKEFETGKRQEALARLGAWANTDASSAMQAWEGTISPIVLAKAEGLSGVLSDKDLEFLKASVPQFGLDDKANKIMISLMRKGMDRALENQKSMQSHLDQHGNLNNWNAPNRQGSEGGGINQTISAQQNLKAADDPLGLFD